MTHMTFAERGASKWFRGYRARFPIERDEFVSAAYVGLVVAARKFDPSRGCKFSTMAFRWINQHLGRLVMNYKRQNGWAYQHLDTRNKGYRGMESVLRIEQWPEIDPHDDDSDPVQIATDDPSVEAVVLEQIDLDAKLAMVLRVTQTGRERTILRGHLQGQTLEQIGDALGISGARVSQILPPLMTRIKAMAANYKRTVAGA